MNYLGKENIAYIALLDHYFNSPKPNYFLFMIIYNREKQQIEKLEDEIKKKKSKILT